MTRIISVIVLVIWRSAEIAEASIGRSSASASCVPPLIVTLAKARTTLSEIHAETRRHRLQLAESSSRSVAKR
jgi:hypothetical protein